ncbi:MFS transporter [Streptomyces sp. NPDC056161]|uniref:MFS transporter n=1 Tax=Streptomyces sp. NPDC056161 TaxID=3345732 RepID=UPI0035D69E19
MQDRGMTQPSARYRWVVLTMCCLVYTMTSVDRSAWGPASPAVGKSLAVPLGALGVFATGYYIGYVLSNAGGGFLIDRFGSRRVLAFSGLGAGAAMICFGLTDSFALGVALQGITGLFAGVDYAAGMRSIAEWFDRREGGFVVGVFLGALSLGTVIANAVVPGLIDGWGWRSSYYLFGSITMVMALLAYAWVRPGPTTVAADRAGRPTVVASFRLVLTNRDLLLVCAAGFGALWGTYGFLTWANNLLIEGLQISGEQAGVVVIIFSATSLVVKPVIGLLIRRPDANLPRLAVITLALFAVGLLGFGFTGSYSQALVLALLLGIGSNAYSPVLAALTQVFATLDFIGTAAGTINAVWQLGSVIVPVVVGGVYASTGSFPLAFATLAAGPAFAILISFFFRQPPSAVDRLGPTAPAVSTSSLS